jgi:hypothetical protein
LWGDAKITTITTNTKKKKRRMAKDNNPNKFKVSLG